MRGEIDLLFGMQLTRIFMMSVSEAWIEGLSSASRLVVNCDNGKATFDSLGDRISSSMGGKWWSVMQSYRIFEG